MTPTAVVRTLQLRAQAVGITDPDGRPVDPNEMWVHRGDLAMWLDGEAQALRDAGSCTAPLIERIANQVRGFA